MPTKEGLAQTLEFETLSDSVGDFIFDKVFRVVYQDVIEHFEVGAIKKDTTGRLKK